MTNELLALAALLSTASLIILLRIIRKHAEIERIRCDGEAGLYDYQKIAKALWLLAEEIRQMDKESKHDKKG